MRAPLSWYAAEACVPLRHMILKGLVMYLRKAFIHSSSLLAELPVFEGPAMANWWCIQSLQAPALVTMDCHPISEGISLCIYEQARQTGTVTRKLFLCQVVNECEESRDAS